MQTFLRSDWAHIAEDASERPARFASFCLISEWLESGEAPRSGTMSSCSSAGGDGPTPTACRMTLAGLCASVVAQDLVTDAKAIVQRSQSFASSIAPLKALVVQRLKVACTPPARARNAAHHPTS